MHAHAGDLRSEVGGREGEAFAAAILRGWRKAPLGPVDRALCAFGDKLARRPAAMTERDVLALRARGLDDRAIDRKSTRLNSSHVEISYAVFCLKKKKKKKYRYDSTATENHR